MRSHLILEVGLFGDSIPYREDECVSNIRPLFKGINNLPVRKTEYTRYALNSVLSAMAPLTIVAAVAAKTNWKNHLENSPDGKSARAK